MQFSDMQTEVFDELREPTDGSGGLDTTNCKRVINRSLAEVVDQLGIEVPADATIALVAATNVYSYPTAFFSIDRIACLLTGQANDTESVLERVTMEALDRLYGDGSWRTDTTDAGVNPTWYFGVGWNQIRIVPTPSDAGTLYVRGMKGHTDLANNTDTSILPDELVEIALLGAVWRARRVLMQIDAANEAKQTYEERLIASKGRWPGRQPRARLRFKMS